MSTTKNYNKIKRFMELAGQETPAFPKEPSDEVKVLRIKLLIEELLETAQAFGVSIRIPSVNTYLSNDDLDIGIDQSLKFNMIEAVDGLLDIEVVNRGAMIALGIKDDELQDCVSDNNLAKFGPGGYRREDGKWIKPPGHKKPDLESIIKNQK